MSLGRLLVAGKSLVGAHDGAGRYRVNKHMALPRFISPRNPFALVAKSDPSAANAESRARTCGAKALVAAAKADPGAGRKNELQIALGARAARWISEWGRKLNPLPRLAKRPGPVKSAAPRFANTPVQSELSLDKIRVVRNDLSGADFEVATKKMPVARPPRSPALGATQHLESAGSTWDRLTTRFFGARPT